MAPRGDMQLAIGYWLVSHKDQLQRWWAIALLGFMGFAFMWTLTFFLAFFIQQARADRLVMQAASGLVGWTEHQAFQPREIAVADPHIIVRDATHIDAVLHLTNPNTDWGAAQLTAVFNLDGREIRRTTYANQSADRLILLQNEPVENSRTAQLTGRVENVTWARTNDGSMKAADFTPDISWKTTSLLRGSESIPTVNVRATIMNNSVYHYRQVDVAIIVRAGDTAVCAEAQTISNWPTATARTMNWTCPYRAEGVTSVEILPSVSRFDIGNTYR